MGGDRTPRRRRANCRLDVIFVVSKLGANIVIQQILLDSSSVLGLSKGVTM